MSEDLPLPTHGYIKGPLIYDGNVCYFKIRRKGEGFLNGEIRFSYPLFRYFQQCSLRCREKFTKWNVVKKANFSIRSLLFLLHIVVFPVLLFLSTSNTFHLISVRIYIVEVTHSTVSNEIVLLHNS